MIPLYSLGRFERETNEFAWQLLFDEEAWWIEYDNDLAGMFGNKIVKLVGTGRINIVEYTAPLMRILCIL